MKALTWWPMPDLERPTEGEAFDQDLYGCPVRLRDGRTGVVCGRANSCYCPYEIRRDASGELVAASCVDFDVINREEPAGGP